MRNALNPQQMEGLNRLGDVFAPGDLEYPKFSELGCAEHISVILEHMSDGDNNDIKTLLGIFCFTPKFIIKLLIIFLEWSPFIPGPVGGALRFARIGIKGLALTLYYSGKKGKHYKGKTPIELMGYNVSVYRGDFSPHPLPPDAKDVFTP